MDCVPELCEDIFIAEIENDVHYYVHQRSHDLRLKINAQTYHLLQLIDGKRSLAELTQVLNKQLNQNISTHSIERIIKTTLEPYGIIKSKLEIMKKDRAPYLRLRMQLVPHTIVSNITRYFQFLIFDKIWYFISILSLILLLVYSSTVSFHATFNFITSANIVWYLPFALFSRLIHEIGHASACEKFKMKSGNIGFGFYLLMPVFYADVSNAWSLAPQKRIIINIAGMYFQLLLSAILVLVYAVTSSKWILYASLFNIVGFLPNLNPFVRYDGYWILSDLLGINNLTQKAKVAYDQTVVWFKNKVKTEFPMRTSTDKFLVLYFFINKIMIGIFLLFFIVFNGRSVFYFPYRFFKFISSLMTEAEIASFDFIKSFFIENLVSILFYILVFRLLIRIVRLKHNSQKLI